MRNPTIRVDNREPATLTVELTYLGYQVENMLLKAGDFEGETIIGEIKREKDFYNSIVDKRAYYQPKKMLRTGKKCYWIIAGDPTDERRKLRPVLDTIFNLVLDYRMSLIPVPKDEAAIAYAIHNIMERKENRKREERNKRRGKNKTDNRNKLGIELLELIPGVGSESARTITECHCL